MKPNNQIIPVIILMLTCGLIRILPHMPNFFPLESLTLFGAAYLQRKQLAVLFPLLMLYVSDFVINNTVARSFFKEQEGIVWFSNYMIYNLLSIIIIVFASQYLLKKVNFKNVLISVLSASVLFFLITNFGAWAGSSSIYSKDISGLMAAYAAGIPFFRTSLITNILFSGVIFGGLEIYLSLARRKKISAGN